MRITTAKAADVLFEVQNNDGEWEPIRLLTCAVIDDEGGLKPCPRCGKESGIGVDAACDGYAEAWAMCGMGEDDPGCGFNVSVRALIDEEKCSLTELLNHLSDQAAYKWNNLKREDVS